MATLLAAYGEEAYTDDAIEVADDVLGRYTSTSHVNSMQRMKDVVEQAIVRFDQLLAVAPETDVEAVQFLVNHEVALLSFVEHELDGDPAHALDQANTLIAQAG